MCISDNYRKLSRNYRKLSRIYRKLSRIYRKLSEIIGKWSDLEGVIFCVFLGGEGVICVFLVFFSENRVFFV